jgi:hypothetical protein
VTVLYGSVRGLTNRPRDQAGPRPRALRTARAAGFSAAWPAPNGVHRRGALTILPGTRGGPTPTGGRILAAPLVGLSPAPSNFGSVRGG